MADLLLDPTVVEEQVLRLNRKADALGIVGVVLGAIPGAAIGGFPIVANGPIPPKYGIASLLLGALLGGVLGHIFGSSRGFTHRLRAQLMLGQLRLEQNVHALLAVSELPVPLRALPAPEALPALPEAPRIEEIISAGLGLPESVPATDVAPTLESTPAAEHEQLAPAEAPITPLADAEPGPKAELEPVAVPEPEPARDPEPVQELLPQAPSWAAALDQVLPSLTIEPASTPEPEAAPAAPAPPAWGLPAREEPAPAPELPATPALPAWPRAEEAGSEPLPAPTPLPLPEPLRPDFGSTTPAWAPPAPAPAPDETAEAEEEPAPPAPAARTDLSSLSIAEIARLADAGSL